MHLTISKTVEEKIINIRNQQIIIDTAEMTSPAFWIANSFDQHFWDLQPDSYPKLLVN